MRRLWWWTIGGIGLAAVAWLVSVIPSIVASYNAESLDKQSALSGSAGAVLAAIGLLVSVGGIVLSWRQLRQGRRAPSVSAVPMEQGAERQPGMLSLTPPEGLLDIHLHGRSALVKELANLHRRRGPRVRILHGMGGTGKTTVALMVTRALRQARVQVWWVSAATETSLQAGMRQLASRLGATEAEVDRAWAGLDSAPDLLWALLREHQEKWLLIVDNADDTHMLGAEGELAASGRGWIRPVTSRRGAVLVTTRDSMAATWHPGSWCQLDRLDMLSTVDGARVLLDHAGAAGTPGEATALAERLGGLALALGLAGRYLADANQLRLPGAITTFAAYQTALDSHGVLAVFEHRTGALTALEARSLVGRTWELSLDLLADRGLPHARVLLRLVSLFGGEPIPYDLLDPAVMASSPLLPGLDAAKLRGLLHALNGLGLLDLGSDFPALRIHPLIRDTSRLHLAESDQRLCYLTLAVQLMEHAGPEDVDDPATWATWRGLASHALQLYAAVSEGSVDQTLVARAARTADHAVRYMAAIGWHGVAAAEAENIYRACDEHLGPRHSRTLHIEAVCAWLKGETGDVLGARDRYARLVPIREDVYGSEHPITLSMKANHAWWTGEAGEADAARDRYAELLLIREQVSGPEDADTLVVRAGLAWWLGIAGDAVGARDQYAALVPVQERICGSEHPSTLVVRANHAWWTGEAGDVVLARDQTRALLPIFERVYGFEHTETLGLRSALARRIREAGDPATARDQFTAILQAREQRSGLEHPDTLAVRVDLANAIGEGGAPTSARDLLADLLSTVERVHGADHRVTKATQKSLATWSSKHEERIRGGA